MNMPEMLAAAEAKAAALETKNAELIAAHAAEKAELEAKHAATVAELSAVAAKLTESTAALASMTAERDTIKQQNAIATAQIDTLKAEAKSANAKAVEMLARVGQTPVVPAVERAGSKAAAHSTTEPKGIDRLVAFFASKRAGKN